MSFESFLAQPGKNYVRSILPHFFIVFTGKISENKLFIVSSPKKIVKLFCRTIVDFLGILREIDIVV